jgi:hypothetical protein
MAGLAAFDLILKIIAAKTRDSYLFIYNYGQLPIWETLGWHPMR